MRLLALVAILWPSQVLPPPTEIPPLPPIPCIPVLDPGCQPPPTPADDEPPTWSGHLQIEARTKTTITISWPAAQDDRAIFAYLIFRDGRFVTEHGPDGRHHRFRLPCGRHAYRVDAVDHYAQRATLRIVVRRRCA